MHIDWSLTSWKNKPIVQQPNYPDQTRVDTVLKSLSKLPPLVTSWEIEALKRQLAEASQGRRFLLQGGDCAETFDECESGVIANKLKILLQMSLILIHGSRKPIIRVGRFAGQYAKPRSSPMEKQQGVELPSFRGDMINRLGFTESDRTPDPELMLRAYERAALTLNFIRSLIDGGFADLHHPEYWDLSFVAQSPQAQEFHRMAMSIGESIGFIETLSGSALGNITRVDFYTSHEGLNLLYEQAQTRQVPHRSGWYNLSTHFPWIGDRSRALDGAHVEYFRGIQNPVGVKIGPSMTPDELVALIETINPNNEEGRLTLIHRFGFDKISQYLPPLIAAVQKAKKLVLWCCDPMHGNTTTTSGGIKTRDCNHIFTELQEAFKLHAEAGSCLGGVHFELTGDNVTECIGGARGLTESDLTSAYKTQCDPRMNYEQALELSMQVAQHMRKMYG